MTIEMATEQTVDDEEEINGVRVVMVMNRKGGCGKSTLVKGLASAAADLGETVTIIDTDNNKGCLEWMLNAKEQGNWPNSISVIHSLDAEEIKEIISQIHAQPDQEHLILIDTKGGGDVGLDELAGKAHLIIVPTFLSRSDVLDTMQTIAWHERLKKRVANPEKIPPVRVLIGRNPTARSEAEEVAFQEIMTNMKVIPYPVNNRMSYVRMDLDGPLGPLRDRSINPGAAQHISKCLKEMVRTLRAINKITRSKGSQ